MPSTAGPTDGIRRSDCPTCGGRLSEPISGDLHCFVRCESCREEFELDDPRLVPEGDPPRTEA